MTRVVVRCLVFSMAILIAGCGSDGMDDLRQFVKTAHADRKPTVEPIPEMKPYERFIYAASTMVDPFAPFNLKPLGTAASANTGPRPDLNRHKEALEEYPLDSLKMVGTLARGKEVWAVLQAPDGSVHRAQRGNFVGQNFGRVIKITEEKMDLVEIIPGSVGNWVEREASIAIVQ